MPRVMACTHGGLNPASRFRVVQYIPYLKNEGWEVSYRPNSPSRHWKSPFSNPLFRACHDRAMVYTRRLKRLKDIYDSPGFDVVFVNRDLLGGKVFYEKLLIKRNPRVIFDFDDAIFLGKKSAHIEWICRNAAWVTAGNEYLADFARRFTERVTVLPTVVDVNKYRVRRHMPSAVPVRVGWCGSDLSIRETLFPFISMLEYLQARLGFEFIIISRPEPKIPGSTIRWNYVEWSEERELQLCHLMDIGIMPLPDTEFHRGKCGTKILQYMAAGIPAVASPVGVNGQLIGRNERGLLAATERQWFEAIGKLMSDYRMRNRIGLKGRSFVEKKYSLEIWLPELVRLFRNISKGD